MKASKIFITLVCGTTLLTSCTKLDESLNGSISKEEFDKNADIPSLLKSCYVSFRGPYQDQTGIWCLQDMTSDDAIGPTRGGDWDDNGVWRVLHQQTWNSENQRIRDNFSSLLQIVFKTTDIQSYTISDDVKAQALFLRAYATFSTLDLYGQVPFRAVGSDPLAPPQILDANAAINQVIEDLTTALPGLADGPANKANKWAAKALLAKLYLNKGTFLNRVTPGFDAADMNQVITLCDEIINSSKFALDDDFFTSFIPANTETSKELIFTLENSNTEAGNVKFHWHCGTHYNQNPSGWNGFATLASFYDKFEADDQRIGRSYGEFTDSTGMTVGFQIGQQYGKKGVKLKDRANNDLIFTRDIQNTVTGNVETPGIRVVKYVPDMKPDYSGDKDNANNDYVMLRYSDVLLMKAEALLRSGNAAGALTIVNELRAKRNATALAALSLDNLLDERGRELYWESWRRNDLIRFGKFLDPFGPTKPTKSDNKYLLFPIPSNAIAANPDIIQNAGY
jgi:hypothetical protein